MEQDLTRLLLMTTVMDVMQAVPHPWLSLGALNVM
jgi:hypothetical protein